MKEQKVNHFGNYVGEKKQIDGKGRKTQGS